VSLSSSGTRFSSPRPQNFETDVPLQVGLAGSWQIAEYITLCVRRNRGIHPGAHVALHLLIWLGAATAVGFLTTFAVVDNADAPYSWDSYYGNSMYTDYLALEDALAAFMYILM
jgi:hypothetical protein